MANWCITEMIVSGDKNELKKLFNLFELFDRDIYTIKQTVGLFDEESASINDLYLGYIIDYMHNDDFKEVIITYESKWTPTINAWDTFLKRFFPKLKQVSIAEECGQEIYVNTDIERNRIPYNYHVCISNDNDSYEDVFINGSETLEAVNEFIEKYNFKFKNIDELFDSNKISELEDLYYKLNPDGYINISICEYENSYDN